jgi:hypothetical protein
MNSLFWRAEIGCLVMLYGAQRTKRVESAPQQDQRRLMNILVKTLDEIERVWLRSTSTCGRAPQVQAEASHPPICKHL